MVAQNFRRPGHLDHQGGLAKSIALVIMLLRVANAADRQCPFCTKWTLLLLSAGQLFPMPSGRGFWADEAGYDPTRANPAARISTRLSLLNRLDDDDAAMTYLRARMRAGTAEVMPVSGR